MAFELNAEMTLSLFLVAVGCVVFQRFFRKRLSREQYFYLRDLSLVAVLMLLALWSGSERVSALVACSLLSMVVGLADQFYPGRGLYAFIILPGLFFALEGASISFLSAPASENTTVLFLSIWQSVLLTTCWMTLFPILFRRLDQIPGLAGHLLCVSLSLMVCVSYFSRQNLDEAFVVSLVSLVLVGAYWSRLGHHFRQLGAPLASLWGTIIAGISIIGVSKGITLTALMVIPLGFYALPLAEMSLGFMSHAFVNKSSRPIPDLYTRVVEHGVDHPAAVRLVTEICLLVGGGVSLMQLLPDSQALKLVVPSMGFVMVLTLWAFCGRRGRSGEKKSIWGVKIDGISMNYALSKSLAWLKTPCPEFRLVVTLNALGLYASRKDTFFRQIAAKADLTLPDGAGLVWAMRMLSLPVIERIAGIDYMDRLCRLAAVESVPVYFLGGKPGIAQRAAENLAARHPGLKIAGVEHGYFDRDDSEKVANRIRTSGARLLFVALGVPAQEKWLDLYRDSLGGVLAVGVGGSFDVFAGELKRAPAIWQKINCEWLYRLVQEPWRFKQDLRLLSFMLLILCERLNLLRRKEDAHA
ncbi:MAG: WecB/TagA/CpsF family glycosyltransferase [Pyramidobacter sp.]|nr:WecB/TagA/CpsF family glycosyltransferase [Pyramidobacter sp.]